MRSRSTSDTPSSLSSSAVASLRAGRWQEAEALFRDALELTIEEPRQALEIRLGLSDAMWWLGRVDEAVTMREEVYSGYRALGDDGAAAHVALWLAREQAQALGNEVACAGWFKRAETLAAGALDVALDGWTALTRGVLAVNPVEQRRDAEKALGAGRSARDGDLEMLALGQLGLANVSLGNLQEGLDAFNEAMAAATAGETSRETLGQLCCQLSLATEVCGEIRHFARWIEVVQRQVMEVGHPHLLAFCATCCAEVFSAAGNWEGAERELRRAHDMLSRTGHRARCIPPAAKLAELMVLQGRIEEAERLIAADASDLSLVVRARLALARGAPVLATTLIERHCRRAGGDTLVTAPALALLVDAHLATGNADAAQQAVDRLAAVGRIGDNPRVVGRAELARARLLAAQGRTAEAVTAAEEALDRLTAAGPGAVETAQAHLVVARLRQEEDPDLARAEAKAALAGFETAGAKQLADEAAALLRALGDRSRVGAKGVGDLTEREQTVLRLLSQGLTNSEIADRLSISVKTAGNHVSNVLMKLGLRSRVEAAAFAVLQAAEHSGETGNRRH